ncbi:MAG: DNA ligase [Streptosporangiales bacterium]|nr:DNA ligase [Streptosporangiales bacterium]
MTRKDTLREYRSKRSFDRTPEPSGKTRGRGGRARFVVHEHEATSLHYDFRLEAAGVLKSWAVPKGPSTDPREKRLAMRTEDHPVAYADFEGVIPEGEYGAGAVIVWDAGGYDNLTEDRDGRQVPVDDAVERGHVTVRLHGEKLSGGYALTRMRSGERERWLLVKTADDDADARRDPVRTQRKSVRSGRTVDEVAAEEASSRR